MVWMASTNLQAHGGHGQHGHGIVALTGCVICNLHHGSRDDKWQYINYKWSLRTCAVVVATCLGVGFLRGADIYNPACLPLPLPLVGGIPAVR